MIYLRAMYVRFSILVVTLVLLFPCSGQKNLHAPTHTVVLHTAFDWHKIADSAQSSLSKFYNASGKYYTANNNTSNWTQYWPTAHTLDVLTDAYIRTGSASYKTKMDDLLAGMKAQNGNTWINHYYDDMEWMALASLRAYHATRDVKYKDIIDIIWPDIKNGWSNDLGGGVWWNKDKGSKNACSNGPAAIFAARMFEQFGNNADLDLATNIYNWEKSKLFDDSGCIYDNMDKNGNIQTSPNGIFTYNQGTFAGAAYELYRITNDSLYLDDAIRAVDYTINSLVTQRLLNSEGGGDGGLFKGIFVRYLTKMIIDGGLSSKKKATYINFLKINAETLWAKGTDKLYLLFGANWLKAPGDKADLTTQLSGIMLIEAMAKLKKLNML